MALALCCKVRMTLAIISWLLLLSLSHLHIPKIAGTRGRTCTLAFSTEGLDWWKLSFWRHSMITSSHQLCAKLQSHHCRGWEQRTVIPRSCTHKPGLFLVHRACPAVVCDSVCLRAFEKDYQLEWFGRWHQNAILYCAIACATGSPSVDTRLESYHDHVLCLCSCHTILTSTIFWCFFFS